VLAHLDCDEKSNEIPAPQTLLRQLGLEQVPLSADAMHCQENVPGATVAGTLLIVHVKDNQPTLLQRAEQVC
jgi:predicted transposase YbfD/YdcC